MNACGKFNWIFDVFKLRKNEREILPLSAELALFPVPQKNIYVSRCKLLMVGGKLIFNALALSRGSIFMC